MSQDRRFLEVSLYGSPVGIIEARGQFSAFNFDDSYLEANDRPVLGIRFEENIRGKWTAQNSLPNWFSNLLPEGSLEKMIGEQLRRDLRREPTEADILVRLGRDLPGAVEVAEVESAAQRRRFPIRRDLTESAQNMQREGLRFSIAGVGMKFSVLRRADKFVAPASAETGNWIVKLPDPDFPNLPINEFASMRLAAAVGLNVPEIALVDREQIPDIPEWVWHGEQKAYAIRRFDRDSSGRVHIEDLAQVRGYSVGERYKGTFETVAALIWRRKHEADLLEMVRRVTLNMLIGNDDAHLKNWSLIYNDRVVPRLSPLYDVVSVEAYPHPQLQRGTGLSLHGSRKYSELRYGAFDRLARKIGYEGTSLSAVAQETTLAVERHWGQYGDDLREHLDFSRIDAHFARVKSALEAPDLRAQ